MEYWVFDDPELSRDVERLSPIMTKPFQESFGQGKCKEVKEEEV